MGIIIALISGLLMSVQGVFNTGVTKNTGMWVCNCFVQFTALIAGLVMWYVTDRQSFMGITKVTPKYLLLGGVIGTAITYTVIKSMEDLGPAKSVMIIVVSQVAAAYLIELFGLFGVERVEFDMKKLVGLLLAVGGIILFKWE
ncbi:MAG: DMT family transporter [Lachnospiraceae bacterium]|nr:DMT family transporter [Lachnospiraceae bacterium]